MDATANFQIALQTAADTIRSEGVWRSQDEAIVGSLLRTPVARGRRNEPIFAMKRAQLRVRRMYVWDQLKQGRFTFFDQLDWRKMVDWIIEHWDEILRVLIVIVPMIL